MRFSVLVLTTLCLSGAVQAANARRACDTIFGLFSGLMLSSLVLTLPDAANSAPDSVSHTLLVADPKKPKAEGDDPANTYDNGPCGALADPNFVAEVENEKGGKKELERIRQLCARTRTQPPPKAPAGPPGQAKP